MMGFLSKIFQPKRNISDLEKFLSTCGPEKARKVLANLDAETNVPAAISVMVLWGAHNFCKGLIEFESKIKKKINLPTKCIYDLIAYECVAYILFHFKK